jgi:stalled ribosome rescue protein Dom34
MSVRTKKQFGVWMDSQNATIIGKTADTEKFAVVAYAENSGPRGNSNENAANNSAKTTQHKYFREITSHMQNVEELHITGTGDAQEQFINYLAETPQFKNTVTNESTSNKMAEGKLVEFITAKFS